MVEDLWHVVDNIIIQLKELCTMIVGGPMTMNIMRMATMGEINDNPNTIVVKLMLHDAVDRLLTTNNRSM